LSFENLGSTFNPKPCAGLRKRIRNTKDLIKNHMPVQYINFLIGGLSGISATTIVFGLRINTSVDSTNRYDQGQNPAHGRGRRKH
jgi:hypothetical protein